MEIFPQVLSLYSSNNRFQSNHSNEGKLFYSGKNLSRDSIDFVNHTDEGIFFYSGKNLNSDFRVLLNHADEGRLFTQVIIREVISGSS